MKQTIYQLSSANTDPDFELSWKDNIWMALGTNPCFSTMDAAKAYAQESQDEELMDIEPSSEPVAMGPALVWADISTPGVHCEEAISQTIPRTYRITEVSVN